VQAAGSGEQSDASISQHKRRTTLQKLADYLAAVASARTPTLEKRVTGRRAVNERRRSDICNSSSDQDQEPVLPAAKCNRPSISYSGTLRDAVCEGWTSETRKEEAVSLLLLAQN
jgi:hypothetical protein